MFMSLLAWTFQIYLLIQITTSFKMPKHSLVFYYKTHNSIFLGNPKNGSVSYGIYVAGKTITVDISSSAGSLSTIVNWKVVNLNKDRLMFVHDKRPQILIDRKTIKEMKYSGGPISGPIIAFGDNEALHVPTINNPDLTKPDREWNYIELLYFNAKIEKVSVIQSLPWLKGDDWKFIKEWKMTDYIHLDDKLYLLIKRTIYNEKASNDIQEISIIRLCLDKGNDFISSAVEIHLDRQELQTNQIIDLLFTYLDDPVFHESQRFSVYTTQQTPEFKITDIRYIIEDISSLFTQTEENCSSGVDYLNLLQYHLRSEDGKCVKTNYKSCSVGKNVVPSANVNLKVTEGGNFAKYLNIAGIKLHQFVSLPFPFHFNYMLYHHITSDSNHSIYACLIKINEGCINVSPKLPVQHNLFVNLHPLGYFYATKNAGTVIFSSLARVVYANFARCTHCIMYTLYFDYIWSKAYSRCMYENQVKNKIALTVNYCFKINNIKPLLINSLPTTLTIELDQSLEIHSSEYLVINAGPDNHCTNIVINGRFINCSMHSTEPGRFAINVTLRNDRYTNVAMISAVSSKKVKIEIESNGLFHLFVIFIAFIVFTCTIFCSFILITISTTKKKEFNEFLESKRATRIMKIASKRIKSVKLKMKSLPSNDK